ncbi:MAG: hypothetical protein ACKO6N_18540 [Myxococcota bacterium]
MPFDPEQLRTRLEPYVELMVNGFFSILERLPTLRFWIVPRLMESLRWVARHEPGLHPRERELIIEELTFVEQRLMRGSPATGSPRLADTMRGMGPLVRYLRHTGARRESEITLYLQGLSECSRWHEAQVKELLHLLESWRVLEIELLPGSDWPVYRLASLSLPQLEGLERFGLPREPVRMHAPRSDGALATKPFVGEIRGMLNPLHYQAFTESVLKFAQHEFSRVLQASRPGHQEEIPRHWVTIMIGFRPIHLHGDESPQSHTRGRVPTCH